MRFEDWNGNADEDGTDLPDPPEGMRWAQGWYCSGCVTDLGEPGDAEPPEHCAGAFVNYEWMLAPA